jgi:hypothetical protein
MLIANIVSTIPGVLVSAFTASVAGIVLAIPLIFVLGTVVRRRLSVLPWSGKLRWLSGGVAVLLFVAFFVVSVLLFELAGNAFENGKQSGYWAYKFLFVTIAAAAGMLISAVLEESVIARLSGNSCKEENFYISVFRANYITLGVVLLVAALEILPQRLKAPHFIVSWLRSLSEMLGTI